MKTAYEHIKETVKNTLPSMAYREENISEWKNKSREKLFSLLGMDKFTKTDADTVIEYIRKKEEGTTEIRFSYTSEIGYRVPCHMLLPEDVKNPPVMICLQGHSTGMHISLGVAKHDGDDGLISGGDRDFCLRAVKEGYAAIALEQRNFGEMSSEEKGRSDCFKTSVTALLAGRTTIGERVWDIMRLIDVLEEEFSDRVNISKIACMGNSGGGTATVYLAALEDRVVLAMPSCAMCTFRDSIGAMHHCACNYVPCIAEYFDMGDLMAMAYPKYFVQVSGNQDSIFPINGAKEVFEKGRKLYKKGGQSDRCSFVEGNGGHRFYADDAWPIVHKYLNTQIK